MWQAEADTELTLSASPATAVGQMLLTMAKFCYNTVETAYFYFSFLFAVDSSGELMTLLKPSPDGDSPFMPSTHMQSAVAGTTGYHPAQHQV